MLVLDLMQMHCVSGGTVAVVGARSHKETRTFMDQDGNTITEKIDVTDSCVVGGGENDPTPEPDPDPGKEKNDELEQAKIDKIKAETKSIEAETKRIEAETKNITNPPLACTETVKTTVTDNSRNQIKEVSFGFEGVKVLYKDPSPKYETTRVCVSTGSLKSTAPGATGG